MQKYSLDEICTLAELPRRTVRYYIQIGLVDRPEGGGRWAYYTGVHLGQLLAIRNWQRSGLSLDRIRDLLRAQVEGAPPLKPRGKGTVEVWTHVVIEEGIELTIEPERAGLSPEKLRSLVREIEAASRRILEQP